MAPRQMVDLSALAVSGAMIAVKVTPNARHAGVEGGAPVRISVTEVAEGGKATSAAQALLAKAMGVAKTRLTLVKGATAREKLFRFD